MMSYDNNSSPRKLLFLFVFYLAISASGVYIALEEKAMSHLREHGVLTQGTVVDHREARGRHTSYHITYTYTAVEDGQQREYTERSEVYASTYSKYPIGSTINVWYQPDKPGRSLVAGHVSENFMAAVIAVTWLGFSLMSLFQAYMKWGRSRQPLAAPLAQTPLSAAAQQRIHQPPSAHAPPATPHAPSDTIPLRAPRKCGCGLCPDDLALPNR